MDKKSIDWERQWETFAPGFKDGILQIPVGETTISLGAGAGFGDLSHPTTQLMLQMLPEFAEGKTVVDIGCGSGILSIAAMKLGAKKVYALDICPESLEHTQKNAARNGVLLTTKKQLDSIAEGNLLILMNMISSEQEVAWQMNACLHKKRSILLTSGILEEQDDDYRKLLQSWGLQPTKREVLNSWTSYQISVCP